MGLMFFVVNGKKFKYIYEENTPTNISKVLLSMKLFLNLVIYTANNHIDKVTSRTEGMF